MHERDYFSQRRHSGLILLTLGLAQARWVVAMHGERLASEKNPLPFWFWF